MLSVVENLTADGKTTNNRYATNNILQYACKYDCAAYILSAPTDMPTAQVTKQP